jgi:hypothetical protein
MIWRIAIEELEEEYGEYESCDDFGDRTQSRHTYLPFRGLSPGVLVLW